ncbi:hypothetical protein BC829DRAFT_284272 [Chytridium lagenaria]|nr:hypothetical protein BC829DRAFT_284272 [Chytridium lagenaria]
MPRLPPIDPTSAEVVKVSSNTRPGSGTVLEIREVSEIGISAWTMLDRIRDMREEMKIPPDVLSDILDRRKKRSNTKKKTAPQKKDDAFEAENNDEEDDYDGALQLRRHTLRFILTDGFTHVVGMELTGIPALSINTPVGFKVRVRNVDIRRGVMMLTPANITPLGGQTLSETPMERLNRLERMFTEILSVYFS